MEEYKSVCSFNDNFTENDEQSLIKFLNFDNWFQEKKLDSPEWITVAEIKRILNDYYFTFSALTTYDVTNIENILSTYKKEIGPKKSEKTVFYSDKNGKTYNDPSKVMKVDGIGFKPFTIYRYFGKCIPQTFDITQDFILYHNLFFIKKENAYFKLNNNDELIKVIEIKEDGDNVTVRVDADSLRNYLAYNNACLVIYYENRRTTRKDISELVKEGVFNKTIKDKSSCYYNRVYDFGWHVAALSGKDIIRPCDQINLSLKRDKQVINE